MATRFDEFQMRVFSNLIKALGIDPVSVIAALPAVIEAMTPEQGFFLITTSFSNRDASEIAVIGKKLKLAKLLGSLPVEINSRADVEDDFNFKLLRMVGACLAHLVSQCSPGNPLIISVYAKHPSPFNSRSEYTGKTPEVKMLKDEFRDLMSPYASQVTAILAKPELKKKITGFAMELITANTQRVEEAGKSE